MSTPASAAVTVSRSRRSPWMNSALGFSHAGFPRRCVCGSRLSRGQKFYFQPDLGCALYRLIEHAFRAPIDLLEQVPIQLLHSNQVIPSIVARTEHNAVLADA